MGIYKGRTVCLFHLHLATVPQKYSACLVTQDSRSDQHWMWSAKWCAVKKNIQSQHKTGRWRCWKGLRWNSHGICLDTGTIIRISWDESSSSLFDSQSAGGKKKKKLQVHLLLRPGFSIKFFLRRLWRVLAIAAKKWHFSCYKAYYIMLWISQDAHEWPQPTEQLTAGYTVAQFLRVPLTFLIVRAECIDRADRVICPASSPGW